MPKWTPQGFYQHALDASMVTSDQFCLVCWEDDDWHRFYPKKFGKEFSPVGVDPTSGFDLYSDASATRWDTSFRGEVCYQCMYCWDADLTGAYGRRGSITGLASHIHAKHFMPQRHKSASRSRSPRRGTGKGSGGGKSGKARHSMPRLLDGPREPPTPPLTARLAENMLDALDNLERSVRECRARLLKLTAQAARESASSHRN